jgi:hypothetical protein
MLFQYVLGKQNDLIHGQKAQFGISCIGINVFSGMVNEKIILAFPNMILYIGSPMYF